MYSTIARFASHLKQANHCKHFELNKPLFSTQIENLQNLCRKTGFAT